jgi:uncharacterized membrane protein
VIWALSFYNSRMAAADLQEIKQSTLTGKVTEPNPSGALCYAFGILFPILYLLTRSRRESNYFLRFHCFQCLLLWGMYWVLFLLSHFSHLKLAIAALYVLGLVAWLTAWIMASRRKMFRLPFIGALAELLASP